MFQTDKSTRRAARQLFPVAAFLIFAALGAACEQAPSMRVNKNKATPEPAAESAEKLTDVQREIRDMETANFKVIYVFKRRDGGVFDREDKKYLQQYKPVDANRFILTNDEKAFVMGSNYPFPLENLEALQKRFVVEDFSKPISQVEVTANSNAGPNANSNAAVNTNAGDGRRK